MTDKSLAEAGEAAGLAIERLVVRFLPYTTKSALPAPGYIGTFELAAATTAQALGVGTDASLALAVLAHAVCVLPAAIAGAVALVAMDARLGRLAADAASASRSAAGRS